MATLPSLPPVEVSTGAKSVFEELLSKPMKSEFERLLQQTPKSDFEKLLEKPFIPKSEIVKAGKGGWKITGARWLGYLGEAQIHWEMTMQVMGDFNEHYCNSEEYQSAQVKQWGEASENSIADNDELRRNDLNAYLDALAEVDVMFKTEVKKLKDLGQKRRYRMVKSRRK
jgi:hypothetical protein